MKCGVSCSAWWGGFDGRHPLCQSGLLTLECFEECCQGLVVEIGLLESPHTLVAGSDLSRGVEFCDELASGVDFGKFLQSPLIEPLAWWGVFVVW